MMNKMVRMFVNFSAMLSVVVCISGAAAVNRRTVQVQVLKR